MKPKRVYNLQTLKYEQERLQLEIGRTEEELGESWGYLKENYKGMVWKQINPFKNSSVLNVALDFIQPGLLPVITELVKGGVKGNPVNLKVLSSSAKYAIATFGIKWLRKFIEKKGADEETTGQEGNTNNPDPTDAIV